MKELHHLTATQAQRLFRLYRKDSAAKAGPRLTNFLQQFGLWNCRITNEDGTDVFMCKHCQLPHFEGSFVFCEPLKRHSQCCNSLSVDISEQTQHGPMWKSEAHL